MAFEIYEMATLFGQRPSDVAILDERVDALGLFYFDRGIATFGRAVQSRVEKAGTSSNAAIAQTQREREWERLMGGDVLSSATGFADPAAGDLSRHARATGRDESDDEEMAFEGAPWW